MIRFIVITSTGFMSAFVIYAFMAQFGIARGLIAFVGLLFFLCGAMLGVIEWHEKQRDGKFRGEA